MKFCKKCNCDTDRFKNGKCKPCGKIRSAKYNEIHKEQIAAHKAKKYASNTEPIKIRAKQWAKENAVRKKETHRKWHLENPESHKSSVKKWELKNPQALKVRNNNRRARKNSGKLSADIASKLLVLQRGFCACGCGKKLGANYHLDHIMPLALGGANEDWNIQLLTPKCNLQKHSKHPIEFMQKERKFLI